jgi:transcriptional regulator with XRE-family HTH domain
MSTAIEFVATDPEPSSKYTPAYREFFARLRRARIEKGLSLAEVAELVGLQLSLAYEFENLIAPLPFEWLEVWCKVVGVPFDDYLAVYWAMEEAYAAAKEREAEQNTQEVPAAPAPFSENVSCGSGWLWTLRAAFASTSSRFLSRLRTPQ